MISTHRLRKDPCSFTSIALGDERAFNELVVAHMPHLITAIAAITKCRHTAEDIVQDTFLKLWSKPEALIYENPGGWLYRVAVHAAYKYLKKEAKRTAFLNGFKAINEPVCAAAENRLISKERLGQLEQLFARLPKMQKKVFWLSREAGLSRDEIADRLEISCNTVKVHLTRAQRFFKEQLNAVGLFLVFFGFNIFCSNVSNTKTQREDLYNTGKGIYQMLPEKNEDDFLNDEISLRITVTDENRLIPPGRG
ncbi:sigma-70 family RNA polymerase sigma factor [Niabella pedocola]|uniref:Sigma-70 family RNA polymerase sigma factor n=1 Tax=Niabella pedocola TaxID=1752077 RepID=A0ABS8PXA6_9BACT|nr:sigma-70 family RNA polymerase sigma factor [Niabella pedocola]MCD2425684.1 sigma-70 family RNA polymerase sigma factor [Niabella pedocola]